MSSLKHRIVKPMIAGAMVAALAIPSLAATLPADGKIETSDTSINIPKSVTLYNDGYNKSYLPAITFSFSIAPAAVDDTCTITDDDGHTVTVMAGPANSITNATSTAVFAEQEVVDTDASLDETVRANMTWNVDLTKFTKPGVYRYTITDTTSIALLYAAGISRPAGYDTTRELDVYIKRGDSGDLEVMGYTLHDDIVGGIDTSTDKDPGFVPESYNGNVSNGFDTYTTYNYEVEKTITGGFADLSHSFPFAITLNKGTGFSGNLHYYGAKVASGATASPVDSTAASVNTTLGNGDKYVIYGLNPQASVSAKETNDTNDVYDLYVAVNGASSTAVSEQVAAGADSASYGGSAMSDYSTVNSATNVSGDVTGLEAPKTTFRNDLPDIPITGVVLKSLPFVALAGIGALMFGLSRKHKKNTVVDTESEDTAI